jgi:hypothetical protein
MPPQQRHRLLDLIDDILDLGAHRFHPDGIAVAASCTM